MEGMELHTKKLLQAVSDGVFGEEWRQLLLEHPDGSVNCMYDLYLCDNCDNWENEEIMDFYISKGVTKCKDINNYSHETPYTLFKKYNHTCSKCGSNTRLEHLFYNEEAFNGRRSYDAVMRKNFITCT